MSFLSALRKTKVERSFFLALLLKPYQVGAILFEQAKSSLVILSTREEQLETTLDEQDEEGLLDRSDAAVSFIEGGLPQGEQVNKTIISLPYAWQEEGKIKKEHQAILKKICHDLQLTPIGFIVSIEAIVHSLQEKEGAPVNAVFVEVSKDKVFVYLVRNGKILEAKSSTVKTNDVVIGVEQLLSEAEHFDVLPARIILLDHENADSVVQEFLSHNWKKGLSFLHLPQVIVLEKGFENEAIINGVASQMGFEVASSVQNNLVSDENEDVPPVKTATPEEFGFVREADVAVENIQEEEKEIQADEKKHTKVIIKEGEREFEDLSDDQPKVAINTDEKQGGSSLAGVFGLLNFSKLGMMVPSILKKMGAKTIGVIILIVFILIAFLYLYYTSITSAEVVVFADKKSFERSEDIVFSQDDPTSAKDGIFHVDAINITVDGQEKKSTSGKKETGEKAKGEIVVYNKTDKPKTFPKGTVATSSNNLDYLTLDEIKIASTSSFSTTFSNAKTKLEASEFGKEYNLPSGTNFTVDNQSSGNYFAKNDSAFSGGTKTEIRVVSVKDMDSLEATIEKNLEKRAREKLNEQIDDQTEVIPQKLSVKFVEKKFNKKEGDEVKEIVLSASLDFKFGTYKNSELEAIVDELSSDDVPDEYQLNDEKSDIKITNIEVDKQGKVSGVLKINAIYMPQIEGMNLNDKLVGKSTAEAIKTLKEIKGVSDVTIVFKRKYPILPELLPFNKKNITIIIKSDG